MVSLFKMASEPSAKVLFSVPKLKRAVMCLIRKYSDMSYSAIGYGFSVNESTVY